MRMRHPSGPRVTVTARLTPSAMLDALDRDDPPASLDEEEADTWLDAWLDT